MRGDVRHPGFRRAVAFPVTYAVVVALLASLTWRDLHVGAPVAHLHALGTLALAGVAYLGLRIRPDVDDASLLGRAMEGRGELRYPVPGHAHPHETPRSHLVRVGVGTTDRQAIERHVTSTLGPATADMGPPPSWPRHVRRLVAYIVADVATEDPTALRRALGPRPETVEASERAATEASVEAVLAGTRAVVEACLSRHAFRNVALMGLLSEARHRCRLPMSAIAWLRTEDEALWHCLNDLGRPSCHVQALGPTLHFRAEVAAGHALPEPQVAAAVDRLTSRPVPSARRPMRSTPESDGPPSSTHGATIARTALR